MRQAVEVHQNVDLVGADAPGQRLVGQGAGRDMVVERGDDAAAEVAAVLGAGAVAEDLEARPVVAFQQFDDQEPHGMAAEVGGEVADPDAVVVVALRGGEARGRGGDLARDPGLPDAALERRVVGQSQGPERAAAEGEILDGQAGDAVALQGPDAALLAQMRPVLDHVGLVRSRMEGRAEDSLGLGIALLRFEEAAAMIEKRGASLIGLRRFLPQSEGLRGAAFGFEGEAEIDLRLVEIGLEGERLPIGDRGPCPVAALAQQHAEVEPGRETLRGGRIGGEPAAIGADGLGGRDAFEPRQQCLERQAGKRGIERRHGHPAAGWKRESAGSGEKTCRRATTARQRDP